jgi:hypothetical protein
VKRTKPSGKKCGHLSKKTNEELEKGINQTKPTAFYKMSSASINALQAEQQEPIKAKSVNKSSKAPFLSVFHKSLTGN